MNIVFESDDVLPIGKILNTLDMVIVVRSVLQEDNKYYSIVYLYECAYESVGDLQRVCNFCTIYTLVHSFSMVLKTDNTETKIYQTY